MKCEYKKGKKSGLDCQCDRCAKIRKLLTNAEDQGTIIIVATPEDKAKLRC